VRLFRCDGAGGGSEACSGQVDMMNIECGVSGKKLGSDRQREWWLPTS
jgi:hypothetical protein